MLFRSGDCNSNIESNKSQVVNFLIGQKRTECESLSICKIVRDNNTVTMLRFNSIRLIQKRRYFSTEDAQKRAYEFYRAKGYGKSSLYSVNERNQRLAWYAAAMVVGTLGATYASVPLYKVFCQATGFGGTTQRVTLQEWATLADDRESFGISRVTENRSNSKHSFINRSLRLDGISGSVLKFVWAN